MWVPRIFEKHVVEPTNFEGERIPFIMLRTFLFIQLISQISMPKFPVFCMDTLIEISIGDGIAVLGGKLVKN